MERIAYSVYAENCPGLEQDSLISSGNSCSCIFGQGVIDVSALSWRHIQGDAGRRQRQGLKMETSGNAVQHPVPNMEGLWPAWLPP